MAHHPKDQEMTNNRYTLLSRMDSHRRQQQIVNNKLDNRRDNLDQRRMLQYSMDNNQMMMYRDNVHDMRVMGMQQQQQGLQTNLNRLDMNNQVMRMNNRQQMQQYRLDNDLNQMQRMDMRLDNNMMRMMTKREMQQYRLDND